MINALSVTLRRELRVCFSLKTQPLWIRILKWAVLLAFTARYHGARWFWPLLAACFVAGLVFHLLYRWQTHAWTRPWGGWNDVKSPDGLD